MTVHVAHADDFTWFTAGYDFLSEAHCVTMVEGITPEDLLRRFAAVPGRRVTGLAAVVAAHDLFEDGEDADVPVEVGDDPLLVAVTELDGWAVAVEVNGYLGTIWELLPRLAEGTRMVSHYRNCNAVDSFHWWEHGRNRLHFEPLFPAQRDGEDAEAPGIPELLEHCGFDLREEGTTKNLHTEAAFALAERLTDVRLTEERLGAADFRLGYAPRP
ncbi:DUF6461 domain-containing protein [Kitasatospora sp. NPDC004240]